MCLPVLAALAFYSSWLRVEQYALSPQRFIGARALSRAEDLAEVFATFAEPHAIGLSALCGLWCPVSRHAAEGAWVRLNGQAEQALLAPLAPGLVQGCGITAAGPLAPGVAYSLSLSSGTLALDGEREIEFAEQDTPTITLDLHGPLSVDVEAVLAHAARHHLLVVPRDQRHTPATLR